MWILTRSGKEFDLVDPQPDMVDINDIAYSLSRTQRFNGHTVKNCNVALHSVMVYYSVKHSVPDAFYLPALMHDAHEAYIGDVTTPIKQFLGDSFNNLEFRVKAAIAEKFNYDHGLIDDPAIKLADMRCLKWEREKFMPKSKDWGCFDGVTSYKPTMWLSKFYDLGSYHSYKLFLKVLKELVGV